MGALDPAIALREATVALVYHSDQGSQCTAVGYQQRLVAWKIQSSMNRRGDYWDNAVAESFFATLKIELALDQRGGLLLQREMHREIFAHLEGFYHIHPLHFTLDYVSPAEFERRWEAQQTVPARPKAGEHGDTGIRTDEQSSMVGQIEEGVLRATEGVHDFWGRSPRPYADRWPNVIICFDKSGFLDKCLS